MRSQEKKIWIPHISSVAWTWNRGRKTEVENPPLKNLLRGGSSFLIGGFPEILPAKKGSVHPLQRPLPFPAPGFQYQDFKCTSHTIQQLLCPKADSRKYTCYCWWQGRKPPPWRQDLPLDPRSISSTFRMMDRTLALPLGKSQSPLTGCIRTL